MRRRDLFLLALAVAVIAAFMLSCYSKNNTENNNYLNAILGPPASPSPGAPSACPTADSVTLGFLGPGTIHVGETTQLNASALAGVVEIKGPCADAKPVQWLGDGAVCVRIGNIGGYTPEVLGLAAGTCTYTAQVDSAKSPPIAIIVQP